MGFICDTQFRMDYRRKLKFLMNFMCTLNKLLFCSGVAPSLVILMFT